MCAGTIPHIELKVRCQQSILIRNIDDGCPRAFRERDPVKLY
jgi:hypothetical protein